MKIQRSLIVPVLCWCAGVWESAAAAAGDPWGGYDPGCNWSNVTYRLGDELRLSCAPAAGGDTDGNLYSWRKDNKPLLPEDGHFELIIKSATEGEAGEYACVVTLLAAPDEQFMPHCWRVRAMPELSMPTRYQVALGQSLTLTCEVRGEPRFTLKWKYCNEAGKPAQLSERVSHPSPTTLLLEGARREDAGTYSCLAGDVSATTHVTVLSNNGTSSGGSTTTVKSTSRVTTTPPTRDDKVSPSVLRVPRVPPGQVVGLTSGCVLAVAASIALSTCVALFVYCKLHTTQ